LGASFAAADAGAIYMGVGQASHCGRLIANGKPPSLRADAVIEMLRAPTSGCSTHASRNAAPCGLQFEGPTVL